MKLLITLIILVTGCGTVSLDGDNLTDCDTGNTIYYSVDRGVGAYCLGSTKMSVLEDGSYQCYWPCARDRNAPDPERCQHITVTFVNARLDDSIIEYSPGC